MKMEMEMEMEMKMKKKKKIDYLFLFLQVYYFFIISMDQVASNLSRMAITKSISPILAEPIIKEIFTDDMDVYSADREARHCILEVPNLYCKKYFDDEDFIFAKLRLNDLLECTERTVLET